MENIQNFASLKKDSDIFKSIKKERKNIGYYTLPFQDLSYLESLNKYTQKNIAVIGIGGSSLGAFAIYDFLSHSKNLQRNLQFFESTDPLSIQAKLKKIDLSDTLFVVISKSGTTLETISVFKYIQSLVNLDNKNSIVISESDSKLTQFANLKNLDVYEIPKNVGGRFSVLSAVGLVPLYLCGVDIKALLTGAKEIYESFFNKEEFYKKLMKKARFISENKDKYNINAIFSYSEMLSGFNKWYIQLWGESLGKIDKNGVNQGLTPIGLLGPVDQHSFLQLIIQGRRDKTVTFIKVDDFKENMKVPNISLENLENLDSVNNLEFSTLINMQADATIESIKELKDVPVDIINIQEVSEYSIGRLIFFHELLTSIVAKFLDINAYDQPGVEFGKTILKEKLKGE